MAPRKNQLETLEDCCMLLAKLSDEEHGNNKLSNYKQDIKILKTTLEDIFTDYKKQITELTDEKNNIITTIKSLQEEIRDVKAMKLDELRNYSKVASSNVSTIRNNTIKKDKVSIVISPKDASVKDSNQTRCIFQKKININTIINKKIGIRKQQKIGKNKLLIQCENDEDAKVINNILLNDQHLIAKVPQKKNPRVQILGISKDIGKEDIIPCIRAQYPEIDKECENTKETMKIIFEKDDRVGTKFAIVETPPNIWKLVMSEKQLFIGYTLCPIKERISILQCYNCGRFGHINRECNNIVQCIICSKNHHHQHCDSSMSKCLNCSYHNSHKRNNLNDDNHPANSPQCPYYQKAIENMRNQYRYD